MSPSEQARHLLHALLEKVEIEGDLRTRLAHEVAAYADAEETGRPEMALVAVDLDRYYTSVEASRARLAQSSGPGEGAR
jgi:hypothetical protein